MCAIISGDIWYHVCVKLFTHKCVKHPSARGFSMQNFFVRGPTQISNLENFAPKNS